MPSRVPHTHRQRHRPTGSRFSCAAGTSALRDVPCGAPAFPASAGRPTVRWQNYFPHLNAFVRSRVHRPIGLYGRPAFRTQPISACALLTAYLLSASERARVRQDTEKKFDAQAMAKLIGVGHTAGEVRAGARTNAYRPT